MIELQIEETLDGIGDKGDQLIIKDDNTWELKKSYSINDLLKTKSEIENRLSEQQSQVISKAIPQKNEDAWKVLTKLHDGGYIDGTVILREQLTKLSTCEDVSELFNKLLVDYKTKGEGDTASIEKIINSCKKEGGNVGGRDGK